MIERGDGHIINVATWRVLPQSSPLFAAYNASKAALSAVSRVIDTEWGPQGVHATTVYYPRVATPMIAATRAYDGIVTLPAEEAANWLVTAAHTRPVRIAPRKALALRALDVLAPRALNNVRARETYRMNTGLRASAPFALRANEQSAPSGLADIGGGNQLLRDAGITQARPCAALGDGAVVVDGP